MAPEVEIAPAERRKVGRPPKLSRELIAQAVGDIGFENLTMKTVADRLGVSVPGLYHYVQGRDDMLRLAAELSADRMELPEDHGQHWAVWLYESAVYNRRAFIAEPGLLKQLIEGALAADRTGVNVDAALGTLVRQGFSMHEARVAYMLVSEFAIGAAIAVIRELRAGEQGRPIAAVYERLLAERGANELPYLRDVVNEPTDNDRAFHEGLSTVLRGIAAARNEKWARIAARLPG